MTIINGLDNQETGFRLLVETDFSMYTVQASVELTQPPAQFVLRALSMG
jgi:hypothetical protein